MATDRAVALQSRIDVARDKLDAELDKEAPRDNIVAACLERVKELNAEFQMHSISAGKTSAEDEAIPSKKPRTGYNSVPALIEQSGLLVKQHLFKPLPESFLPSTGSQVLQWLFDFTELKVPVTPLFYQEMLTVQGPQQYLIPVSVQASVVVTFTELLQKAPRLPCDSEMNSSIYMCGFMERCWEILQKFSPTNLQHDLKYNKASQFSR